MNEKPILLGARRLLCNQWSRNVFFNENLLMTFVTVWIKAIAYLSNF